MRYQHHRPRSVAGSRQPPTTVVWRRRLIPRSPRDRQWHPFGWLCWLIVLCWLCWLCWLCCVCVCVGCVALCWLCWLRWLCWLCCGSGARDQNRGMRRITGHARVGRRSFSASRACRSLFLSSSSGARGFLCYTRALSHVRPLVLAGAPSVSFVWWCFLCLVMEFGVGGFVLNPRGVDRLDY